MFLNVQRAARLLGVSPHTVRRWTSTGFLPCSRTPGGHRRIRQEDVLELAQTIGGSNHLAAQRARERELETLVDTSIAVTSRLELPDLLREIARRLTSLMDCQFCAISDYDPEAATATVLADYDAGGRRLPASGPYELSRYPLTKRVLEAQELAVVNVDDPRADSDEVRELRRDGDKSLLMLPLVFGTRSIGLLELFDHVRERHYTRQELRLCRAVAGQAAVALHNAQAFAELGRADRHALALQAAVGRLAASLPRVIEALSAAEVLRATAAAVCESLGAASCVVTAADRSAGATGTAGAEDHTARLVVVKHARETTLESDGPTEAGGSDTAPVLTLTASLTDPPLDGEEELLRLLAAVAASSLARFLPAAR